ncbi:MAG: hypothetical protein KC561_19695, partial [Myxococcales bacterium]|nr:hypothetical protein [Myxococcales bacterium]
MKKLTWISILLVAASLSGCWHDAAQVDQVTWSDDDSTTAFVKLLYEESSTTNPLSGTSNKRNFRHQVFVESGSGYRALTPVRDHQNGASFYYMRQAGYILLDGIVSNTVRRWDLIDLATGNYEVLATHQESREPAIPCAFFEALPSWDGQTIAILERTTPGATPTDCASGSVVVQFYDVARHTIIATHEWPLTHMLEATWTPDNELVVFNQIDGAWTVSATGGPERTTLPTCFQPRTS